MVDGDAFVMKTSDTGGGQLRSIIKSAVSALIHAFQLGCPHSKLRIEGPPAAG